MFPLNYFFNEILNKHYKAVLASILSVICFSIAEISNDLMHDLTLRTFGFWAIM